MSDESRSWWESELYDRDYDLLVVGGGLTGQSTALFYKRMNPGSRILVVDRGFFPLGASTRNAGFACFGSPTEHIDDRSIEEEAKIIERIGRRISGLRLLRDTLGDGSIDYREEGAYEIFTDHKTFKKAKAQLSLFNEWVKKAAGWEETYTIDTFEGYDAVKIKGEGCLHPGKMMKTLYSKNLDLGIEFRWNCRVNEIRAEEGEILVEKGLVLKASQLMIATNAFTSSLLPDLEITPCRGQVFVSRPISDLKWKGTFHYDKGYYYFRNIGDRLLMGGARNLDKDTEFTSEFGINGKIKDELIRFTNEVLKISDHWEIEQQWSGIMGFSPTKSPYLRSLTDRTVVAAGLSGMGVALGMQLGKEAADKLTGL
ncbi:NAD(P)/FAD-dependent oxidoreductase [Balneola sp. MJW-20]|uniref:NAD(P)/FAD-dependent oxidoreductase n=1 Tax=Gracilimonas aurantiaca TaxID=3234185 RepID=UPI0034674306